jgi:hypothetical protein
MNKSASRVANQNHISDWRRVSLLSAISLQIVNKQRTANSLQ